LSLVVQKYGGSSLANADGIKRVAQRIVATRKVGHAVVVVVSAMGDATDELHDLALEVSPLPPGRELDMLLTAGERISMALVAMAIANLGFEARSFTGSQAGVITDSTHGKARIIDVTPGRISGALADGAIPIVAGFQGVSQHSKDITTLGRGGSDTTAVALAAALGAQTCEIYTDVDGVFTADPRIVPSARRIPVISYDEMLEMAACGAKVLHLRCVEYARHYGMPIHVRSSFSNREGTWVTNVMTRAANGNGEHDGYDDQPREDSMDQPIITGVAHDRSEATITVAGVPDKIGVAAKIFRELADTGINIDMIVQSTSRVTGRADISFTLPRQDGLAAMTRLRAVQEDVGFESLVFDESIGKISLIGAGMRSHPGVSADFFGALADNGVNIRMISTSEIRISAVVDAADLNDAVSAAHRAFGLDDAQGEAVVYAGTGR
jgi:aspartate kinase